MSSPRAGWRPSSDTPPLRWQSDTQRVHWDAAFIEVLTSAPRYLSLGPRALFSWNRLDRCVRPSTDPADRIRPPWSQIGNPADELISRNSITPSRRLAHHRASACSALLASVLVRHQILHAHGAGPLAVLGCQPPRSGTCGNCRRSEQPLVEAEARNSPAPAACRPGAAYYSGGTSISLPVDDEFVIYRLIPPHSERSGDGGSPVYCVDEPLGSRPEVAQQPLQPARPRRRRRRKWCGLRSMGGDFPSACRSRAFARGLRHAFEHAPHPAHAFAGTACTGRNSRACRNRRCAPWL